jgi:hypothetical protein
MPPIEVGHLIVGIVGERIGLALPTSDPLNSPPFRRFSLHSPHQLLQ